MFTPPWFCISGYVWNKLHTGWLVLIVYVYFSYSFNHLGSKEFLHETAIRRDFKRCLIVRIKTSWDKHCKITLVVPLVGGGCHSPPHLPAIRIILYCFCEKQRETFITKPKQKTENYELWVRSCLSCRLLNDKNDTNDTTTFITSKFERQYPSNALLGERWREVNKHWYMWYNSDTWKYIFDTYFDSN